MEVDVQAVVRRAFKKNETRLVVARELWKHTPFYGEVEKAVFGYTDVLPAIRDKKDGWVEINKNANLCDHGHYIRMEQQFTYNDVVRFCPFVLNEEEAVSRSVRQISCYLDNLKYVIDNEQIKALARMAQEELNIVERYLKRNSEENR